jgi:hypothetical protein
VNKGKRTETILEATMAINRRLPNGNTETSTLQVNSVPVVLEESSAKSVELAATTEALSDLYTRVGVKPQDPGDEFELKYGVNISYISSKGKVDGQFIPIGSVTGSGGHLHNFEDFGFDTDAPTRLR